MSSVIQGQVRKYADLGNVTINNFPDSVLPAKKSLSGRIIKSLSRRILGETNLDYTTLEGVLATLKIRPITASKAEELLHCLANLCRFDEENRKIVGLAGGCEILSELYDLFPSNLHAIIQLLYATNTISMYSENAHKLFTCGTIEKVVKVMKAFIAGDALIPYHGCSVFWNFSMINVEYKTRIGELGACDVIVKALQFHGDTDLNVEVTQEGLGALWNLSINCKANCLKFGKAEALGVICRLVKVHGMTNESVAHYGIGALMDLSMLPANRLLLPNDVCQIVTNILKVYNCDNIYIAESGFRVVTNLSFDNVANKKKFSQAGTCQVIIEWINQFYANQTKVLVFALTTMLNLMNNYEPNKVLFADISACELLIKVADFYATDDKVIPVVCGCIRSLAQVSANQTRFKSMVEPKKLITRIAQNPKVSSEARSAAYDCAKMI